MPRSQKKPLRCRDKKVKLAIILNNENSYLNYVVPTALKIQSDRPPSFASDTAKLTYEIDLLTYTVFAVCPLRKLNWSLAEWDTHLRRVPGEGWSMHVPIKEQKNRSWLTEDLTIVLPKWVSSIIEHYYRNVREKMAVANPAARKFVLAGPIVKAANGAKGMERTASDVRSAMYNSVSSRMKQITEKMWGLSVSCHDWRDIYATDYINKHPDDILTLAAVLNDKPETVIRDYAKPSSARLSKLAAKVLDTEYEDAVSNQKLLAA